MRIKLYFVTLVVIALAALTVGAQSNTFTYQGRLTDNNLAAVGTYEMQFRVFDAAAAGNQLPVGTPVTLTFTVLGTNPVTVSNGAFTVQLNFGNGVFTGADRWLEISVRKPSDPPGFTLLTPRQPITSSPYSIKTLNAASADSVSCNLCITDAQISGIDGAKVIGNVASATTAGNVSGVVAIANGGTGSSTQTFVDLANPQTITGAKIMSNATNVFTGSGAGLTNISPTNITPGTASINIAGIAAAPAVVTSGATPSVAGRTMLTLNYATPTEITDLTGGVDGQCVVLLGTNQNVTLTDAGNFNLSDNYQTHRLFTDSTITLCKSSPGGTPRWFETARSINIVVGFLSVSKPGTGSGTVTSDPSGINCGTDCNELYEPGTIVTLTATPSSGSTFTGWSGGGCSGTGTCTVTVPSSNLFPTATFTLITFPLSVSKTAGGSVTSSPAGINCGGDCNESYPQNTVVTLTRQTDAGASFLGWGGACSAAGTALTCDVTMDAAKNVTATFGINLTVTKAGAGTGTVTSNPGGINCGANCSAFFAGDSLPVLTAVADPGSVFTGWTASGCSGTGTCTQQMFGPRNVTATFALQQFTLSVSKAGTGTGTVTSSPAGISCGADCSEPYNNGTTVTLTAAPSVGSTFSGWSGGGCSGTGTCTTTVTAAQTVTATFAPQQFNLSVSLVGTGSGLVTSSPAGISCGGDCSELYNVGTTVTLTATTFAGTTFTGWSGGGCSGTFNCSISIFSAATVTATFTLQQFNLNVTKAGSGTGTVTSSPAGINCGADCSEPYNSGTSVTLTATPAGGSTFTGWSGGGCSGTGTCTTTIIASATTVTATFDSLGPALLTVSPSTHGFGSTGVGSPTATVDFTVTNTGGASSGSMVTQLTGTDPNEFQITADTCLGNVLSPGNTCTVTVRFNPMSAGNRAATLGVQATPGGLATSTLSGIGM